MWVYRDNTFMNVLDVESAKQRLNIVRLRKSKNFSLSILSNCYSNKARWLVYILDLVFSFQELN